MTCFMLVWVMDDGRVWFLEVAGGACWCGDVIHRTVAGLLEGLEVRVFCRRTPRAW